MNSPLDETQKQVWILTQEIHSLRGKIANRKPGILKSLQTENQKLKTKASQLQKTVFNLTSQLLKPRSVKDSELQYDSAYRSAVEFFKTTKADAELWKNIES